MYKGNQVRILGLELLYSQLPLTPSVSTMKGYWYLFQDETFQGKSSLTSFIILEGRFSPTLNTTEGLCDYAF